MDMKNAASVCLISLFSATLVVLIARSLDSQAAARLEPQLAKIAEELHTLRMQSGVSAAPSNSESARDGLVVYYFHSNTRCPTCQAIESQTNETLQQDFAPQLSSGEMVWKVVNYEDPSAKPLATKFAIQMPVVVLARMQNGEIQDWKRLDEVLANVNDKAAFAEYVKQEVERMLVADRPASDLDTTRGTIPVPSGSAEPAKETPSIPIP